ncbi:MAG: transposase [Phycisphaerae bacterium]
MPRIARVVIPDVPHHLTQRGNRREDVFFDEADRRRYLVLLLEYSQKHALEIWAYCLMTNHVHVVAVPREADALAATFKPVDMRYTQHVNRRLHATGHLWQGRFYSCPLDDEHLWEAVRYVERNPVRAGLVKRAEEYPWSSAAAHCGRRKDPLVQGGLETGGVVRDWSAWLRQAEDDAMLKVLRRQTRTGRPAGDAAFVARLEELSGRFLAPRKGGRPRKHG